MASREPATQSSVTCGTRPARAADSSRLARTTGIERLAVPTRRMLLPRSTAKSIIASSALSTGTPTLVRVVSTAGPNVEPVNTMPSAPLSSQWRNRLASRS
jgi:hypothetical protein